MLYGIVSINLVPWSLAVFSLQQTWHQGGWSPSLFAQSLAEIVWGTLTRIRHSDRDCCVTSLLSFPFCHRHIVFSHCLRCQQVSLRKKQVFYDLTWCCSIFIFRIKESKCGLSDPEHEGSTAHRNVRNHSPIGTMSYPVTPLANLRPVVPVAVSVFKMRREVHEVCSTENVLCSSCIRLLPCLPVTSLLPSTTCFRRQFLRKTRPVHLEFLLYIVSRKFFFHWFL